MLMPQVPALFVCQRQRHFCYVGPLLFSLRRYRGQLIADGGYELADVVGLDDTQLKSCAFSPLLRPGSKRLTPTAQAETGSWLHVYVDVGIPLKRHTRL